MGVTELWMRQVVEVGGGRWKVVDVEGGGGRWVTRVPEPSPEH